MENFEIFKGTDRVFLRLYSCSDLHEQSQSCIDGFITDEVFGIWRRYASGSDAQIGELWVQKFDISSVLEHSTNIREFRHISLQDRRL